MQFRNLTALILISSLTAACGGGGDSLTIPSTPIAITEANAEKISADAYATSDLASQLNFIAVSSEFNPNINQIAQTIKNRISNQANNTVVSAASYACTNGGSMSFPDVSSSTDFSNITITLSSCNEGGGVINGDLTLSFNFDSDTMSITGNRLTITQGSQGVELINYSFVMNGLMSNYSITLNYTLNSTELNGQITVTTTTAFQGTYGGYPTVGVMVITGANNTKAIVTAISATQVQIEVFESNVLVSTNIYLWSYLESL